MMGPGTREASKHVNSGSAYQRVFRCVTDTQLMGPNQVLQSCGFQYGDRYLISYNGFESDQFAYLTELKCHPEGDDGIEWRVTAIYTWYDAKTCGGGAEQNPLEIPVDVSWGWRDNEVVVQYACDAARTPVANSADDPFDPPVTINDPQPILTVVRNEATFNVPLAHQYRNAVASDSFAGFDPLCSKVVRINSASKFHPKLGFYWQTTYEFQFITANVDGDPDFHGFRRTVLNQGLRAYPSGGGAKYHVTIKGLPITTPVFLDTNGYALLTPPIQQTTKTFQTYPELPFEVFKFDPDAISGQRTGFNTQSGPQ